MGCRRSRGNKCMRAQRNARLSCASLSIYGGAMHCCSCSCLTYSCAPLFQTLGCAIGHTCRVCYCGVQKSVATWVMFLSPTGVRGLFAAIEGLAAALASMPLMRAAARTCFSSLKRLSAEGKMMGALTGVSPCGSYTCSKHTSQRSTRSSDKFLHHLQLHGSVRQRLQRRREVQVTAITRHVTFHQRDM